MDLWDILENVLSLALEIILRRPNMIKYRTYEA